MSRTAIVALGSNLDDREGLLRSALAALASAGRVTVVSSFYESAPVGPEQPDYLNAVALVETDLAPEVLLERLLEIETSLGRVRERHWGPRRIDLDIVAVDGLVVRTPTLTLPHPEAHRRAFVLAPLTEVAPHFVLPGWGPAGELLGRLTETEREGVRRLPP
jgi:2-amino-4-hydroxy-6-hydroxymethyldihydropteridine diphosphokinase